MKIGTNPTLVGNRCTNRRFVLNSASRACNDPLPDHRELCRRLWLWPHHSLKQGRGAGGVAGCCKERPGKKRAALFSPQQRAFGNDFGTFAERAREKENVSKCMSMRVGAFRTVSFCIFPWLAGYYAPRIVPGEQGAGHALNGRVQTCGGARGETNFSQARYL